MRLETLASILRCIDKVSPLSAEKNEAFISWLEKRGDKSLKAFAGTIAKLNIGDGPSAQDEMTDVAKFVGVAGTVVTLAGVKAASSEINALVDALQLRGHSVSSYLEAVEGELTAPKAKPTKKAEAKTPDIARVRTYVDLLITKQTDNAGFDDAVVALSKDKSVGLPELRMIAERFVGHDISGKTKKALIGKIVDRQELDARHAAKSAAIG